MVKPILVLTLSVMAIPIPAKTLARLKSIRPPVDYFGDVRPSNNLWPHDLLCFTRNSRAEISAEPLARHHHHRYVLIIPCHGNGTVYVDDLQFSLKCSQALLIFPFQYHHGFHFDHPRALWLFITFELSGSDALESLRLQPNRKLKKEDFSLAWNFVEAWTAKEKQDEPAYWIGLLLTRMLKLSTSTSVGKRTKDSADQTSPLLVRINHYCMQHLQRAIGLKELSMRLGISESYLRARFRAETRISLGQHLRRLRLQKAMGLLLQSELSISQIAERCGFGSIYAFSRAFRKFTGMMATEYRRRFSKKLHL